MAIAPGYFRVLEAGAGKRSPIEVQCYLGEEPPKVVQSYAVWEEITRPKRKSLTEWQGVKPLRVQVSLMIDYFNDHGPSPGIRCQKDMRNLELLAGATQKGVKPHKPPRVNWWANAVHDNDAASHLEWVVESLEWGDLTYNNVPNVVRATCTIVLLEWVEDQFIRQSGAKKNTNKKGGGGKGGKKNSTYRVTLKDTQRQGLKTIALKKLGDSKRWREIAKLQKPPIRDPMAIRVNQILKMPKK
jgi:hypothetical protein